MLVLCLSFLVVLLDQATKYVVRVNIDLGDQIPVISGFFNITYVQNTGAAWGILSGYGFALIILSVIMLSVLIIFRQHLIEGRLINEIALAFMIAGIIGNLIDRLKFGYVVDFLDFYIQPIPSHFPAFNVADSSICIGVALYVIAQLFQGQSKTADEIA